MYVEALLAFDASAQRFTVKSLKNCHPAYELGLFAAPISDKNEVVGQYCWSLDYTSVSKE